MKNQCVWTSKSRSNQSGQALVEYLLILIVSITLVLGLMLQFFKPMQVFVKNYMGTYVQCLLETGELPALNSGQSRIQDTSCGITWAQAVAQGNGDPGYLDRATNSGGGRGPGRGGAGSAGSGGKDGSAGSKGSNDQQNGRGGLDGGDRDSAGAGPYAGSSSRSGRSNFSPQVSNTGADGGDANQNKKSVTIELNEGRGSDRFFRVQNVSNVQSRARKVALDMSLFSAAERKKIEEEKRTTVRTIANEGTNTKTQKKIVVKPPAEKTVVAAEEEPMGIGSYLRIFFIICIILLLIILLGGQALQISKGWEK